MSEERDFLRSDNLQSCELELLLRVRQDGDYNAYLRFTRPGDDTDIRMVDTAPVTIDRRRLGELKNKPTEYGAALWSMLFGSSQMQRVYERAYTNARDRNSALRLRLFVFHDAPELHSIWWETLVEPESGTPILMREDFVFSRYLDSSDGRPVVPQPARTLRVLCAIANSSDIDQYTVNNRPLAKPDLERELLLGDALGDLLNVEVLSESGPVSLARIVDRLRDGFDILYLVCHGGLVNKQSRLYLEDDSGCTAVVAGEDLVARLRDMVARPRLVVLASCQSAASGADTAPGDDFALTALGPRLMDAGLPAVVAMQGNITMDTVQRFMPVLFEQLSAHGQIDRAMAVARGAVRDRRDWWMPVLFMRLRSGALWYRPSAGPEVDRDYRWEALIADLEAHKTVMVLGTGLGEAVLGSSRDIARRWADEYSFPMATQKRDDLPQVTQYLAYTRNPNFPLMQLRRYLIHDLSRRHARLLKNFHYSPDNHDHLDVLIREIGGRQRALVLAKEKANERARDRVRDAMGAAEPLRSSFPYSRQIELPYSQLARLPVSTYVTCNRDNLLYDSLKAEGRRPEIVVCCWKPMRLDDYGDDSQQWPLSVFDCEPDYAPSVERPLIYHVFGNMSHPHTVVLTEDDYFDFLVGFTRNQGNSRTSMPSHVKKVLATHGLVFLGFQFEDWEFRTMFRGVVPREGAQAGTVHSSVAVQMMPNDDRMHEPVAAREYLKTYFNRNRNIEVYWRTTDDFLTELTKRWIQKKS
jgi:hypothetical protein